MAGNAGSIRAGAAFVELFADKSKLVRGLKSAEKTLQTWASKAVSIGKTVAAAGVALTTPFVGAAKLFSDMGSALIDMSGRTGASVETLSSLGFAAEQTGATLEDVEMAMKKFAKSGFATGRDVEAGFRGALISLGKIKDPVERSQKAMELFGKAGTKLLPMAMDLAALEERARSLGLVMSTKDAQAADALGDAWGELWSVAKMGVFQIGAALAPALMDATNWIIKITAATVNWVKENRGLVITAAAVAVGVAGAGAAIMGFGVVLKGLAIATGAALGALAAIKATFAGIAFVVAAVTSPLGLLTAAIVGTGLALLNFTQTGQQLMGMLGQVFVNLKTQALDTFKGISDALMAGDIKAAANVLWASLKLLWAKGTSELKMTWNAFLLSMLPAAISVAQRISDVFIDMVVTVAKKFLELSDMLSKIVGKDLLDPAGKKALETALPFLGDRFKEKSRGAIAGTGIGVALDAGKGLGEASKELADAQKAFDDSVKAAAEARRNAGLPGVAPGGQIPGISLDKTSTAGTFSAAAAQGIGGASQLDDIATATKLTAKNTKKLANLQPGIGFT